MAAGGWSGLTGRANSLMTVRVMDGASAQGDGHPGQAGVQRAVVCFDDAHGT
jgi:hypothetical protein